jgi:hypothetical protein
MYADENSEVKLVQYKIQKYLERVLHMEEVGKNFSKKMSVTFHLSLNCKTYMMVPVRQNFLKTVAVL